MGFIRLLLHLHSFALHGMIITPPFPRTPIVDMEQLKQSHQQVSLEDFGIFEKVKAVPSHFDNFARDVKQFIQERLGKEGFRPVQLDIRAYKPFTEKYNYASAIVLDVYVPPGLTPDLKLGVLEYADVLINQFDAEINGLIPSILKPTFRWMAKLLADPQNLSSVRDSLEDSGIILNDLKGRREAIAKCLKGNNASDRMAYGKAFRRHGDMLETVKFVNELNTKLATVSRNEINELVSEIAKAVDALIEKLEQNREEYAVNGRTIRDIAALLLKVAEHVEFYATFTFLVQSLTKTMEDNAERFGDLVKE